MLAALISFIGALIIFLLGLIVKQMADFKTDFRTQMQNVNEAIACKADDKKNDEAHSVLHKKIENHYHDGKGNFALHPHAIDS